MQQRLILAAIATLVPLAPASAIDLPARKPGLWELTMTFEGRNLPPRVTQNCIDAQTDAMMNAAGNEMSSGMCSKQDVQKTGGTIVTDSVCKIGNATVTTHGVISGDFNSAYTVKSASKREGAPMPGMPANGETKMTIEAKWLGACRPDQKPGDMIMGNGMKINIRDMQQRAGVPQPKR